MGKLLHYYTCECLLFYKVDKLVDYTIMHYLLYIQHYEHN